MAGFDRSKFKATPLAALKGQEDVNKAKRPKGDFDKNYLKINDGDNKFRLFPPHPEDMGGGTTFAEAKCVTFLEVTRQKRDSNNKPIDGEFEVKRVPIFHAKVHGDIDNDPADAYIDFMRNRVLPDNFESGIDDLMKEVTNGQTGVKPSDSWVTYAAAVNKDGSLGEFGLLEFRNSVKNQLTELASEQAGDDVQSPDPFTDPDDGVCIIINKTGKGLDTEYKVRLDIQKTSKLGFALVPTPIPDEMLQIFMSKPPLKKEFVNVYNSKHFEQAIEGIKNFDEKFAKKKGIDGAFSYEEFMDVLSAIDAQVPVAEEQPAKEQQSAKPAPVAKAAAPVKKASVTAPVAKAPVKAAVPVKKVVAPVVQEEESQDDGMDDLDRTFAEEPGLVQEAVAATPVKKAPVIQTKATLPKRVATPAPVAKKAPVAVIEETQEEEVSAEIELPAKTDRLAAFRNRVGK